MKSEKWHNGTAHRKDIAIIRIENCTFMGVKTVQCPPHLVFMARALAVLGQALHSLINESDVLLIYIETQQAQTSRGAPAYTI